jgi:hypothetical protein
MSEVTFIKCMKCKKKCLNTTEELNLMFGYNKKQLFYKTCVKCRNKRLERTPECSICFNHFSLNTDLKCGHQFCRKCLNKWVNTKNVKYVCAEEDKFITCPVCRVVYRKLDDMYRPIIGKIFFQL